MTKDTEELSQLTDSVACREYTLPRDEGASEPELDPYWKLQPVACAANMELRSESCPWTKTILTRGSEFLMPWSTSRKPQKCSSKNMRWDWMRVILQVDQRPKQNHKNEILPAHPQELYQLGKEFGPMMNQENIQSPIMKCWRNWFIFFVMESTSRKWWSNWILENQRQSSETFLVLSSLVWRQV